MSVIAIHRVSPSIAERVLALLQRLIETEGAQGRLYKDLRNLPDHLLLDIGIDPRGAPLSLDEAIARPDLAHGGVVAAKHRAAAKS